MSRDIILVRGANPVAKVEGDLSCLASGDINGAVSYCAEPTNDITTTDAHNITA